MLPAFCFANRTLETAGTIGKDALTVGMSFSTSYFYVTICVGINEIQKLLSAFVHPDQ